MFAFLVIHLMVILSVLFISGYLCSILVPHLCLENLYFCQERLKQLSEKNGS